MAYVSRADCNSEVGLVGFSVSIGKERVWIVATLRRVVC